MQLFRLSPAWNDEGDNPYSWVDTADGLFGGQEGQPLSDGSRPIGPQSFACELMRSSSVTAMPDDSLGNIVPAAPQIMLPNLETLTSMSSGRGYSASLSSASRSTAQIALANSRLETDKSPLWRALPFPESQAMMCTERLPLGFCGSTANPLCGLE